MLAQESLSWTHLSSELIPAVIMWNVISIGNANNGEAIAAAPPAAVGAAGGGGAMFEDDEDEGRNRDWLDWLYVGSRLGVLLSIIYFYSTVGR